MAHRIGPRKESSKRPHKVRLVELLLEKGHCDSLEIAKKVILAGEVRVNGEVVDKAGSTVPIDSELSLKTSNKLVGRGGLKLEGALKNFNLDVQGIVCADVGSSTGGFTQVLLNAGATKVYAIDVGYGELDWKLRSDARVCVMERTNARYLDSLPEPIKFVSIDVSFISLDKILPAVKKWIDPQAKIVCLVKPQFEAAKSLVGEGGIVKNPETHRAVLMNVIEMSVKIGFQVLGLMPSPIKGAKGNVEFLLLLEDDKGIKVGQDIEKLVSKALLEAERLQ